MIQPSTQSRGNIPLLALACAFAAWCDVAVVSAQVASMHGRGEGADLVAVRDDWLAFEPVTVEELLQHVPGVIISRRGGLGSRLYIQVAGSPTGRLRLFVDGISYDEPELAWARLVQVPVAAIERIEVHRFTDPARLEVWTRQADSAAPMTDIELARGDLVTRTRRVQFQTPRRSWWVSGRYDEVLRGVHDFRTERTGGVVEQFGSFNGRHRSMDVGFDRPNDEQLRYRFEQFVENSHGSAQFEEDVDSSRRTLNSLRWSRNLGASRWTLDTSYTSWHRSRVAAGIAASIQESRGVLALDVDVPYGDGHRQSIRLRAHDYEGLRNDFGTQFQRYDVELQTHRSASALRNVWLGWHHHETFGPSWSARAHARWEREAWALDTQAGRGVSYAGWGEVPGIDGERPGLFASLGVSRTRGATLLRAGAFAKHLKHRTTAASLYFPDLGNGPQSIVGATGTADWRVGSGPWLSELAAHLAWVPWVDGERGGHPKMQAELRGRWSRLDLFQGDLVVTLQTLWRFETTREFTEGTVLGAFTTGDVRMHLRVLRRMLLFWNILNVTNLRYETHPGVTMPDRRSLFGVRVQLIN